MTTPRFLVEGITVIVWPSASCFCCFYSHIRCVRERRDRSKVWPLLRWKTGHASLESPETLSTEPNRWRWQESGGPNLKGCLVYVYINLYTYIHRETEREREREREKAPTMAPRKGLRLTCRSPSEQLHEFSEAPVVFFFAACRA